MALRHGLFFSLAGHFGMSLSRVSPRLPRARRRLQHRRCAVMFTSQIPCQSSGCYCVVPLNLLAPPWMLWRAFFGRRSASAAFAGFRAGSCRGPCGPAQIMGRATPILALGSHFSVAFVRLLVLKRTKRRCLFGS